ncbi:hypothetical protein AJ85_00115 [Alkalihalobacillus alcalophilus ATCC 27647 = CGMCC 1.3604]|uniref:Uncharacterized protein n=1 Tax=Alkalihalobacillus alcalophilus ATCC 27647 = CGMCC 1.3604 TaxID=1218173 RepID=A0A094WPD8_ALKAL|nr:hypothetical protein [Alkalihalobacillus alcalophilus]KGA98681.1 hypothetical protein BALCAV_0202715 [Alkalihalobacillus alcalophilus ATCC 27647 = CGMCC 1.3604]MED1560306.1 hypothetical protein [Alkalihalobacillus alcalophilus]THG88765.1 hypothetical protein AJ85_00115 [Alkalihalobacillus alcalophilus ATCC 27647 = CGMCC 1.3604]
MEKVLGNKNENIEISRLVRSKKKRIRNKVAKRLNGQLGMNQGESLPKEEEFTPKASNESVSVSGLPVTKLLKLGKAFFKEQEVIKYYYTVGKEPFYKNKELLIETIEQEAVKLPVSEYNDFIKELSNVK